MSVSTDPHKIEHLLTHQVDGVIVQESLEKKLKSGEQLRVKLGADPSRPDLHIGHAVVLRKLREFQDLGHKVIFIIGDFTAKIGDPTGKSKTRPMLTDKEIRQNAKTYLKQVGKILDVRKCEIRFNSKWLGKLKAHDMIELTSQFTTARILERDDFTKRMKSGTEIHVHELLYPMLQAYDSIELDADIEIGGTDQTFNMLAGRDLARRYRLKEQDVMTCPLLVGTDGVKKMSKSLDNYIAFDDTPDDMYGKTMSIPDEALESWLTYAVNYTKDEIEKELVGLKRGDNPRDCKARLAKRLVEEWHGAEAARKAEEAFIARFRKGETPEEMPEIIMKEGVTVVDMASEAFGISRSEARRLIEQKGLHAAGTSIENPSAVLDIPEEGLILQKGKRHFVRIKKK